MTALDVLSLGAVTPLGLSAPSTCAAFRAGIKALGDAYHPSFPAPPVVGARVSAQIRLRRSYADWLINLACRALSEALQEFSAVRRTALLITFPGSERQHPEIPGDFARKLPLAIQDRIGKRFAASKAFPMGSGGGLSAIIHAKALLASRTVDFCCIGGVDSLLNTYDVERLRSCHRLKSDHRPIGVMPSEGAAFYLVSRAAAHATPLARILGAATSQAGCEKSTAPARCRAFEQAMREADVHESKIAFTVSDHNGERTSALDWMVAEMRTFRTRRESMPHWRLSESCGDTGAAAGALSVVVGATAHMKGYAPGPMALCAGMSDCGDHVACVLAACTSSR